MLLLLGAGWASPGGAQGPAVHLRVGAALSSTLAEDAVASTLLRQRLGAPVAARVSARAGAAPMVELAAALDVGPAVRAELGLGYSATAVEAEEAAGATWEVADLGVGQAFLSLRWQWRPAVALSGGFGAVRYMADERAFFAGGGELNPGVQAALEAGVPWGGGRSAVRAFLQAHRFNTPALRRAGSSDGTVLRMGVQGSVRLLGGRP